MVTGLIGTSSAATAPNNFIFNKTTSAAASDSFVKELVSQLQGIIDQSGNGSHFQIDIQSETTQNADSRQFLVTVKNATPVNLTTPAIVTPPAIVTTPP